MDFVRITRSMTRELVNRGLVNRGLMNRKVQHRQLPYPCPYFLRNSSNLSNPSTSSNSKLQQLQQLSETRKCKDAKIKQTRKTLELKKKPSFNLNRLRAMIRSHPNREIEYLRKRNVLDWCFHSSNFVQCLDKREEAEWGQSIIGYRTNQWTTRFGERCLYEMLILLGKNPQRIRERKIGENGKELVPDWEADDALYECKARMYTTTGSAGEKILGTPDKYKECYRLYNKPLKIVCMGYQEREAEVDFCRFEPKSKEGVAILEFYKTHFGIEYVKATDLLKEYYYKFDNK